MTLTPSKALYRSVASGLIVGYGVFLTPKVKLPTVLDLAARSGDLRARGLLVEDEYSNRWGFIYADVVPVHGLLRDAPGIDLQLNKPTLSIDGARVASLDGFFDEVSRSLIPGARWGRNLNAFNDILYGGFGTPAYGFVLIWRNAGECKDRLGEPLFSELVQIIEGHEHIELTLD